MPVVDSPYGRLSTAICNDNHFPSLIRQAGQKGVDIMMTPYSAIPSLGSMDYVTAVTRSIENGFSLVRATGNGASNISDYEGRVLGSQDYYTTTTGILISSVPTRGVTTIYSRVGDLFAYLCVTGLIFIAGLAFLRREQPATVARRQPA